jgi:TniQ
MKAIRRLAPIPDPYPYETLGSWLTRLARSHYTSRTEFVRALLAESGVAGPVPDVDVAAPPALLEALAHRTGWRLTQFRRLTVPGGAALMEWEGGPYCPTCWREGPAARYVRREWRMRWSVTCQRHGVLLRGAKSEFEGAQESASRWKSEDCGFQVEMGWLLESAQTLLAELEAAEHAPAPKFTMDADRLARARVLRDLALLAGTRFAGGSLVEWTLPALRGPINPRRLYWSDAQGRALPAERVAVPTGSLVLRQHALRVAWILWLRAYGCTQFEEPRDVLMVAVVALADPEVDLSAAVANMIRRWPAGVQARWSAEYGARRAASAVA